jgi:hypothetical protein
MEDAGKREPGRAHPYPTDSVVGVIDAVDELEAALGALTDGGFPPDGIEVLCGEPGIRVVDASGRRHGVLDRLVRVIESFGPEREQVEHLEEEFRQGHFGVGVTVDGDERKQQAADILRAHGGHDIYYYGRWTIEEL